MASEVCWPQLSALSCLLPTRDMTWRYHLPQYSPKSNNHLFQGVVTRNKHMGECKAPGIQQRISKMKTFYAFWKMVVGNQIERQVPTF